MRLPKVLGDLGTLEPAWLAGTFCGWRRGGCRGRPEDPLRGARCGFVEDRPGESGLDSEHDPVDGLSGGDDPFAVLAGVGLAKHPSCESAAEQWEESGT
jgi:hypothetical protein